MISYSIQRQSKLSSMFLTIVLVNYNTAHLLHEVMDSLRNASSGIALKIIIIDNASKDDSVIVIQRDFPECTLIANTENVGFGRANNQAIPLIESEYVLFLNTDAFVATDTLEKSMAFMDAHRKCGVLGVRLVGRDGEQQLCARSFPTPWKWFLLRTGIHKYFGKGNMFDHLYLDHQTARKCDWVVGCFYMVRKEVIDTIGLFDPRFFLYFEEVDHCRSVSKAGWDVYFLPDTSVVHIGGESAKSTGSLTKKGNQIESLQIESELLYFRKHLGVFGIVSTVALNTAADTFNLMKHVIARSSRSEFLGTLSHLKLVWSLFWDTGFGTKATR